MASKSSACTWYAIEELKDRAIVWQPLGSYSGLDPYVAWADATQFPGLPDPKPLRLPFLVRFEFRQCAPQVAAAALQANFVPSGSSVAYSQSVAFASGTISVDQVLKLRQSSCINLGRDSIPNWRRLDAAAVLALPRIAPSDTRADVLAVPREIGAGAPALNPMIAIVDDGCPFANAAYATDIAGAAGTRVLHLWDQNGDHAGDDPHGNRWKPVAGFGYGREAHQSELSQLLRDVIASTGVLDEDEVYRRAGLPELVGRRFTHGAHVMGLAAGAPDIATSETPAAPLDAAGKADIIFVQLPSETMRDTSGGSLATHLLDALRYIDLRATSVIDLQGNLYRRPVVVNLSVGASAGPHDGTSLIDQAIDAFVKQRNGLAVMVAAGNARERALHQRIGLPSRGSGALAWTVASDDGTDSHLEVWLPMVDEAGAPARVALRLVPPGHDPSACPWVGPGETAFLLPNTEGSGGAAIAGVVNALATGNSTSGQVVLCSVAATAADRFAGPQARPRAFAPAGEWAVEIVNLGDARLDVSAWIERDDPAFGSSGRQSSFDAFAVPAPPNDQTLSSLAHAESVVLVGGYTALPVGEPVLDRHSGEGSGRAGYSRRGPDFVAPSDESAVHPGLLSHGVHSGEINRLAGTSVATAVATRRIFNFWQGDPNRVGNWSQSRQQPPVTPREPQEPESRAGRGRLELPW